MIHIADEKDCCGCGVCSISCPNNCITMQEGSLGHLFPKVDHDKCIDCGICDNVCPMHSQYKNELLTERSAYAAYAKDEVQRFRGSSGGMFGVFAQKLIDQGYTVYGAAFDEHMKLVCTSANNKEALHPLYKSKYLQSNMSRQFTEIQNRLKNGDKLFFVSTPCQVLALKTYLKKEYPNLITVDFFCHGVPSQKLFDQCMLFEEKINGGKITQYEFRTKRTNGATPHYYTETICIGDKEVKTSGLYFQSPFYALFQKYINLRESCYQCKFAGKERFSDITIGDFHDIDKYIRGINRFKGVSTVVINTAMGMEVWNSCQEQVMTYPVELNKLISEGVCFGSGTKRPSDRDQFLKDYEEMSIDRLLCKWANPRSYRKQLLYYGLPKCIRFLIRKIMGV